MSKFICGFCGNEYSDIESRMKCEISCSEKNKNKERLDEISKTEKEIETLAKREEELVAEILIIKDQREQMNKRLEELIGETEGSTCKCSESRREDSDIFKINGKRVSGDDFFAELSKVIK